MFRCKLLAIGVTLTYFLGTVSCSIKEDRSPCPCYLNLNVDQMVQKPDYTEGIITVMTSDRIVEQSRVTLSDYEEVGYDVTVPRKTIHSMVAVGHDDLWWNSDTLLAAANLEWGPVMLAKETSICDGDDKFLNMDFHKEYCRINFILVGVIDVEGYPFDIRVRANSNALRMRDGMPVNGNYNAYASPLNTGMHTVLVPRQKDDGMIVDILVHSETHEYTSEDYVFSLELGKSLDKQGYRWDKQDLDDVYLNIDIVKATCSVLVVPWENKQIDEEI